MKSSLRSIPRAETKNPFNQGSRKPALSDVFSREPEKKHKLWRKYQKKKILLIGAGGLGGFIALGLVRKAVGKLTICDGDIVEISNLNRQWFTSYDLGNNKAKALVRRLKHEAVANIELRAIDMFLEEAIEESKIEKPDLCLCMPDNDEIRRFAAAYCLKNKTPLIISGLSHNSDYGYIFVQTSYPGNACWGCFGGGNPGKVPCGAEANINLPMVAAGFVLTACDAIVSGLPLPWNYRRFSISGALPETLANVQVLGECSICGKKKQKLKSNHINSEIQFSTE